ncbi:MAG: deoxyribonuclease IV [Candidatus Micrarchaeota archaeon]|nr:deoxyribonuclease IV [Candidatus Micrarchaeota archaeon]
MIRAGFHLSVAGGIYHAPEEAERMGYMAFQLFASSPRTWGHTQISEPDAAKFRELSDGRNGFAHIPYLCNPSTANPDVYKKSRTMLIDNMSNCAEIGVKSVVIHLGSHLGKGLDYGKGRTVETVSAALDSVDAVTVLLENSSGYKNCVGDKMEDIGDIIKRIGSKRVGLCFDTCHAFAAGYDIRTREGVSKIAHEIESYIGKERLGLVHLNDAKFELGSGLDRHWHIGKGNIGEEGFRQIFSNRLFREGNFVMETPIDEVSDNLRNMKELQKILASCGLEANI